MCVCVFGCFDVGGRLCKSSKVEVEYGTLPLTLRGEVSSRNSATRRKKHVQMLQLDMHPQKDAFQACGMPATTMFPPGMACCTTAAMMVSLGGARVGEVR